MALEKNITFRHNIEPNGIVFVETISTVTDDGAVVGSNNHRKPINPGDDYSAEADVTKAICAAVQTESVVSAFAEAAAEDSSEE